jgi:hypothetical protein
MVLLQRANVAPSEQQRTFLLRNAESECRFSFDRTPPTSPLYRQIAMNLKLVQAMLGTTRAVSP